MRRSTLALAAILGASALASATCDDTLYLQSITVYRQSLKNDTTLGTWDSTVVNPWSLTDLLNAGPVGYSMTGFSADTVRHYLRFSSDCTPDSVSNVLVAAVRDSLVGLAQAISVDTAENPQKVDRIGDGIRVITLSDSAANYQIALTYLWQSTPSFQIGLLQDSTTIEGWTSLAHSYTYTHNGSGTGISLNRSLETVDAAEGITLGNIHTFLQNQPLVSATGGIDSVRIDLALYKYVYGTIHPSAIVPRTASVRGFSAHGVAGGVEIQLGQATRVQIMSVDGKMATSFAAHAGSNLWDGRGASGNRLPGLWIVRAEGVGAVPVVLR
jgi:hypothetical protein